MITWLKKTFWQIVARFRPEAHHASPPSNAVALPPISAQLPSISVQQPTATATVVNGSDLTPDTWPEASTKNRKQRRTISALERARRKHDKFVEPQGTPPAPRPKQEHEQTPATAEPEVQLPAEVLEINDQEIFVADKHHTGGDEDVLYKETEFYGEYNFRDTILEQLDRYWVYLRRMKTHDAMSYGFYKRLGATILPYAAISVGWETDDDDDYRKLKKIPELPPYFNKFRPTFGCFAYGANPVSEKRELEKTEQFRREKNGKWLLVPKFMYFLKFKEPPPELQPMSGGDIYQMTVWWDRPHDPDWKKKCGSPQQYGVFISSDGKSIQVLRMIETKYIDVLVKKKRHDANGNIDFFHKIPQRAWRIPHDYEIWANEKGVDVQTFLGTIFVDAVRTAERANYSVVRVAVHKDDMTAVFGVNVHRMAYFFQDRDYVLNAKGSRKQVFHMVRSHERETKNGVAAVRFHFRGEREFTWAGYKVSITVPGKDHFMMPEVNLGLSDEYWTGKSKDTIDQAQIGELLDSWMKQGKTFKAHETEK
jgi:hypothetical protein